MRISRLAMDGLPHFMITSFHDHGISFKSIIVEEKYAPINDIESLKQREMKKIIEKYTPEDICNTIV